MSKICSSKLEKPLELPTSDNNTPCSLQDDSNKRLNDALESDGVDQIDNDNDNDVEMSNVEVAEGKAELVEEYLRKPPRPPHTQTCPVRPFLF